MVFALKPCHQQMVFQLGEQQFDISLQREKGSISRAEFNPLQWGDGGRGEEEDPGGGVNRISRCPAMKRILTAWDYSPQTLIACQKTLFISSLKQFQMHFQKPQHRWQQQRQHSKLRLIHCGVLILSGGVHPRSVRSPFFSFFPGSLLHCHMSYVSRVGLREWQRRVTREMGGKNR